MNTKPLLLIVGAALLGVTLWVGIGHLGTGSTTEPSITTPQRTTASVERNDLDLSSTWSGVLSYAASGELLHRSEGGSAVLTTSPLAATIVDFGEELYRVNDDPVILLHGDVPLWRSLQSGDDGPDVMALETSLVALGYDEDATVTIDESYTNYTAAMVERFQEAVGQEVIGEVPIGSIVFASVPLRVGEQLIATGATLTDGLAVLSITSSEREVSFEVEPQTRGEISVGDRVEVRLPDRSITPAEVLSISPTIDADTGSYTAIARPDSDNGYRSDQVAITVLRSSTLLTGVQTVPANALVAIEGDRWQVRLLDGDTITSVDVDVLGQSGQLVAIDGDAIQDGMIVLTP